MNSITVKNYQGIESAQVELADGVNCFVGQTDTGKSSFFRALRDWAYNCLGNAHVMSGADFAEVVIDGVGWKKGKDHNSYSIGDEDYDSVGRGIVPDEVQIATGIREVAFGDGVSRRLNISEQFGSEFMVGDKPSDNAKVIGSLSGIHIVFNALRSATADHKRANKDFEICEQRIEETGKKIKSFAYLEDVSAVLQKASELMEEIGQKEIAIDNTKDLKERHELWCRNLQLSREQTARYGKLAGISLERCDAMLPKLNNLKSVKVKLDGATEELANVVAVLANSVIFISISLEAYGKLRARCDELSAVAQKRIEVAARCEESRVMLLQCYRDMGLCTDKYNKAIDGIDICPVTKAPMLKGCKDKLRK